MNKYIIYIFLILFYSNSNADLQTSETLVNTITVIDSISISKQDDLHFGTLYTSADSSSRTLNISAKGVASGSAVSNSVHSSSNVKNASFLITAEASESVTYTITSIVSDSDFTISSPVCRDSTMDSGDPDKDCNSTISATTDGSGNVTIDLGATLSIDSAVDLSQHTAEDVTLPTITLSVEYT